MSHREYRSVLLSSGVEQRLQNDPFVGRVEIAGRFVGEHHAWLRDQRAADRGSLTFAMTQSSDTATTKMSNAQPLKQATRPIASLRIKSQPAEAEGKEDVFLDVEMLQQPKVLEDETDSGEPEVSPSGLSKRRQIRLIDQNSTGSWGDDSRRKPEKRRLPATARTDHGNRLAAANLKRRHCEAEPIDGTHGGRIVKMNVSKTQHGGVPYTA